MPAQYKIPYQNLTLNVPDDGEVFKGNDNQSVYVRKGDSILTLNTQSLGEQIRTQQGLQPHSSGWSNLAEGINYLKQIGLDLQSIPTYNIGDVKTAFPNFSSAGNDISQFQSQPKNQGEVITKTQSPTNQNASIETSSITGIKSSNSPTYGQAGAVDPTKTGFKNANRNFSFAGDSYQNQPISQIAGLNPITLPNGMKGFVNSKGDLVDAQGNSILQPMVEKYVDSIMEGAIASGKTISPNITDQDMLNLDFNRFISEAERIVAPEYKEKVTVLKNDFARGLANIGYDISKKESDIERQAKEELLTGTEDLAGRGLAFSGEREKFTSDLDSARQRAIESARETAFRIGQEATSKLESEIGTPAAKEITPSTLAGRNLSFSSSPLQGTVETQKKTLIDATAQGLEKKERERLAYVNTPYYNRNLGFA